jgi:thioredoxin reductase
VSKIEVCIIGGGPAGLMTAIQLKRYGMNSILIEKNQLGGLLWNANLVENYPGFPKGVSGEKLVSLFTKQYQNYGLEYFHEKVEYLDFEENSFLIQTNSKSFRSKFLVIAIGTCPKKFPKNLVSDLLVNNVFYEIYPIAKEKKKTIAIIGAGDAAFDYAINLSRMNKVKIINRSETIKALPLLVSRSKNNPNIEYFPSTQIEKLEKIDNGLNLTLSSRISKQKMYVDILIGAIGREANIIKKGQNFRNHEKELLSDGRIHCIGDVKNGIFRQTAIAVGDGLRAAMQIYQFQKEQLKS